ncbi:uncharacterized protein LOC111297027 isoform X3 [Durio zibethinus]|uniref:Uncharacterized protein LOC111297027 isoform X3 n=1 Tax=Durio zibethinus TaxID=66656 RepID=A0A6P5Z416_DURZI|nr:uncharacterized protein LOC111297027 isoform X3 [Durio zibethinus]
MSPLSAAHRFTQAPRTTKPLAPLTSAFFRFCLNFHLQHLCQVSALEFSSAFCFMVKVQNPTSLFVILWKKKMVKAGEGKQDSLCDRMPGNVNWQMSPKGDGPSQSGCKEAEYSCPPLPRTGSQQSSVSVMSESPVPTFVYSRRKKQRGSSSSASASFANFCAEAPVNSKRSVDCLSIKTVDVDSINDSCSSSKSYMELALTSMKGEMDENGECSSSSVIAAEVVREDLSEKDMCFPILRNQGNFEDAGPSRAPVNEEIGTSGGSSCSRSCKICGRSETAQKMLICDNCEEAYHVRCCNPKIKKIPVDEWYCISCMKKKRIMLMETTTRNSSSITGGMGRCRVVSSKGEFSPIELMLRDAEPYRTSVRIGKGIQAEVPDWSGPIDNDVDTIDEPLELDPSEFTDFHELNCNKSSKLSSIGNWLQCRGFVDGVGGSNGTICGKWRRAPLFEVQTDDWECFCSVQWDPSHADCSVPQELEKDQVLKQLKYIEMLRPRLSAKRRKTDQSKNYTSQDCKEEMRNAQS